MEQELSRELQEIAKEVQEASQELTHWQGELSKIEGQFKALLDRKEHVEATVSGIQKNLGRLRKIQKFYEDAVNGLHGITKKGHNGGKLLLEQIVQAVWDDLGEKTITAHDVLRVISEKKLWEWTNERSAFNSVTQRMQHIVKKEPSKYVTKKDGGRLTYRKIG